MPVISTYLRLICYDVKLIVARIQTHNLWIRKGVCYSLHPSALQYCLQVSRLLLYDSILKQIFTQLVASLNFRRNMLAVQ